MLRKQGRVLLGVSQVVLCSSNYCIDLDPLVGVVASLQSPSASPCSS